MKKKRIIAILTCLALVFTTVMVPTAWATPVTANLLPGEDLETEVKGEIHYSKHIIDDADGNLAIQLDAYTEGAAKPLELVMIVDQSASMYQTANGNAKEYNKETNPGGWMRPTKFLELHPENVSDPKTAYEGAESPGYYISLENYGNKRGCARLIRWNEDRSKWEISNPFESANYWDEIGGWYEDLLLNPTFADLEDETWEDFNTTNNNKIKVFKTMMGATIDSFNVLLDEVVDLPNAKVAVVGFSSSASEMGRAYNKGGTGVFVPN